MPDSKLLSHGIHAFGRDVIKIYISLSLVGKVVYFLLK